MISKEEVLKLAELARLKLGVGEAESLQKDISNILEYVGQVSTAKGSTSASAAEESPLPAHRNVLREDVPTMVLGSREALLKAFPTREGDFNVVRKIIQKDE